ncbi:MAG: aminotransferase class I/II-fold pyridoxal phosphate-dependent enzyme [Acidobacteriia bacterium]|nr:aminotransferase class I/II-fold pyridoxal phosphate-dependent enzyme [Terriglobia bacterium]
MIPCDLRSDTVTQPTAAMRAAIAAAPVGDDVFGEDPTIRALELRVCALLAMPDAVFTASGTMANQLALMSHCRRGDSVVVPRNSHMVLFETGASAAISGIQTFEVGDDGHFDGEHVRAAARSNAYIYPPTRLVVVENTHNYAGGRVTDLEKLDAGDGRGGACRSGERVSIIEACPAFGIFPFCYAAHYLQP